MGGRRRAFSSGGSAWRASGGVGVDAVEAGAALLCRGLAGRACNLDSGGHNQRGGKGCVKRGHGLGQAVHRLCDSAWAQRAWPSGRETVRGDEIGRAHV